jgi:protein-S-isoprenylcysteine O-methyltransferase Ste14
LARPLLQTLRAIAVLPANVTLVVPAAILWATRAAPLPAPSPALRIGLAAPGALLVLVGLALMVRTIRLFHQQGQGTLAPWDPTRRLVVRGVYRHVRNPMITGVCAVLLGEAALFSSLPLLAWFLVFASGNALFIPLWEEPGLVRRFGPEYLEYRRHVPRWLPRLRPWSPPEG